MEQNLALALVENIELETKKVCELELQPYERRFLNLERFKVDSTIWHGHKVACMELAPLLPCKCSQKVSVECSKRFGWTTHVKRMGLVAMRV
jgi:hypothetical protein